MPNQLCENKNKKNFHNLQTPIDQFWFNSHNFRLQNRIATLSIPVRVVGTKPLYTIKERKPLFLFLIASEDAQVIQRQFSLFRAFLVASWFSVLNNHI